MSGSLEGIAVRPSEAFEMIQALLASDPDLLAEADKLFLGEKPRYESGGLLNYLFCIPASAADGADGETLAFRPRNKDERFIVLLAPEDHGLVPLRPEITPEMIEAGFDVIADCWIDFIGPEGSSLKGDVMTRVFLAMTAAQNKLSLECR